MRGLKGVHEAGWTRSRAVLLEEDEMRNPIRSGERRITGGVALLVFSSFVIGLVVVAIATPAAAIPAFARKEGQACGFCHTAYPKLNEAGRAYKQNGFRFPGEYGNNIWEEPSGVPLSFTGEVEVFLDHNRPTKGTSNTSGPDGKIDEVEIMGAGTLSNRASFFTEIEFDDQGNAELAPIWIQVNDLAGPQGALNLQIGQYDAGLPFFSEKRRVIRNKYLAFDRMGFLDTEFGGGVNGQYFSDPDEEGGIVHRYGAGVFRAGSNDDGNMFTKGMGWYNLNWNEVNNLGIIATGGQDETGGNNFKTTGLGAIGQTECGKWTLTAAYFFEYQSFKSNSTVGGNQQFHNIMGEVLYMPDEKWVLGGRVDWLTETERDRDKDWGLRASALTRYNVVSNVWLGGEYRFEEGGNGSPVTSSAETHKARLFAFFAY